MADTHQGSFVFTLPPPPPREPGERTSRHHLQPDTHTHLYFHPFKRCPLCMVGTGIWCRSLRETPGCPLPTGGSLATSNSSLILSQFTKEWGKSLGKLCRSRALSHTHTQTHTHTHTHTTDMILTDIFKHNHMLVYTYVHTNPHTHAHTSTHSHQV